MRPTAFWAISVVLLLIMAMTPALLPADQAQYFYDELGRLVGVVDGQGNMAEYEYDAVGNLLAIRRHTVGQTGIAIFLLAPGAARTDVDILIHGFGFSETASDNQVQFNGTAAAVVSATPTSLVVRVPLTATSGPVTVTNANGTATSPKPFTVLLPPIITGLEPARVAQGSSSRLVIAGFNLATATAVTFTQAGLSASILAGATSQSLPITLTVGSGVPPGAYPFSVVSPEGTVQSGTITVTVATAVPSVGITKGSVFLPFPHEVAPSGVTMSVAPPVSVSMP